MRSCLLTQTTFTFGACVTEMPLHLGGICLSQYPPGAYGCCAHSGGEEIEGCTISLSTIAYPRLCTLSHPSSNLWGERVENAIRTGGGDIWTRLHGNRGWLTGSASNPTLCYLLLSIPPPPPPAPNLLLVPVSGAVVEISMVRWCYPLAAHTISLYPSPQRPSRSSPRSGTTFVMLRQRFLYLQRLNSEVLTPFTLQPIF